MKGEKVKVTQIRGLSGHTPDIRSTTAALGLGKIGKSKEFSLTPAVYGMIRKVRFLVEVKKVA